MYVKYCLLYILVCQKLHSYPRPPREILQGGTKLLWGPEFIKKVWIQLRRGVLDTTLCDKVCHWHAAGQWFSLGTTVSSTNKTNCHNISEILLKVALNTITLTLTHYEVLLKKIIEHTVLKRERVRKKKRVQFVPTKLDLLLRNNILNI